MAKPPRGQSLSKESIPNAPDGLDELFTQVSEFMSQTSFALQKGLTFAENFNCQVKTVKFTAPEPTWTAPTLLNSHANLGLGYGTVGYRIDHTGEVWLKGVWVPGAASTEMWTMPEGYWPDTDDRKVLNPNSATGGAGVGARVDIDPATGQVIWILGGTSYASLDGCHYTAASPCAFPPIPTGWPVYVAANLDRVIGLGVLECRCSSTPAGYLAGSPTFEWERGGPGIRLKNVSGLVPGRNYEATLVLFGG
jgi:hypothetical protein